MYVANDYSFKFVMCCLSAVCYNILVLFWTATLSLLLSLQYWCMWFIGKLCPKCEISWKLWVLYLYYGREYIVFFIVIQIILSMYLFYGVPWTSVLLSSKIIQSYFSLGWQVTLSKFVELHAVKWYQLCTPVSTCQMELWIFPSVHSVIGVWI